MPPLGGPGPRRVNAGAVRRRQRNIAKLPKRAAVYVPPAAAYRPPKRAYTPPAPATERATPARRPAAPKPAPRPASTREIERGYRSQAKAISNQAARQQIVNYLGKEPKDRRAAIREIKAKKPDQVNLGDYNILRIHGQRQGVDVRQRKETGFVPRAKYGYTPRITSINVMPRPVSPELRAAIGTNPKLKARLGGLTASRGSNAAIATLKQEKAERAGTVQAPALKLIEQPMRGLHAVAGAGVEDVKTIQQKGLEHYLRHGGGKAALKAAGRGATLKDRKTTSDILTQTGWKPKGELGKAAKAVVSLGGDIALNPLTPVTGGTGGVAARAGEVAASKALGAGVRAGARRAALRKVRQTAETQARKEVSVVRAPTRPGRVTRPGEVSRQTGLIGPLTRAQHETVQEAGQRAVSRVAQRARTQAEQAAPKGKGITVRLAGQEVPGVRRGTAAVGRGAGRVVPKAVPRLARKVTRPFRPTIRAQEYPAAQFEAGLHAAAGARAQIARAERKALTLGQHLKANLPKDSYDDVIRALERNDIKSLPAEQRDTVIDLRSAFRQYFKEGRRAGVIKGEVGDFGNWLKKGEARKLLRTIESETAAQTRRVGQAGLRLERAGSRVKVAETEAVGRQRVSAVRLTEQERRRQDLARERELGRPGVTRRGTEPAPRVTQESALRAAEARGQAPAPAPTVRVQRAAAAHGERVQELEAQVARTRAAKSIPAKRRSESDEQYLTRVRDHAREHDLPLVERRAAQLLKDKPEFTRGYYPREFQSRINKRFGVLKKGEPVGATTGQPLTGKSGKVSRITAGYRRGEQRPVHQVNVEREKQGLEPFSTDVPVASVNYGREAGKATAEAGLAHKLGGLGRQYKPPSIRPGESVKDFAKRRAAAAEEFSKSVGEGEQLYFVGSRGGKFDLHEADTVKGRVKTRTSAQAQKRARQEPGRAARQALEPLKGESGRYVVLNKQMVDELRGAGAPQSDLLAGYDRALGRWKGLAIANPAFHIRNLIGDIRTASYEQPLLNLLGRTGPQAAKAIRRESATGRVVRPTEAGQATKFQRGARKLGVGVPTENATIKIAGERQPLDRFLKGAHEDGIIDAGYVGGEVRDLISQGVDEVRGVRKASLLGKGARATGRWTRNRENIMRLATYKGALDRGMSRAEARRLTSELHIDYGHLSQLERRGLRRAAPFYTWTARSIPLTAKKYVTRPGKFAAYESARQETAKAFGIDPQKASSQMTKATQGALPFTVRLPGRKEPVAVSWSDPMTLLGDLPTSKNFPTEAKRLAAGQLAPFPKWAIEMATNRNLMTGKDIEGKHLVTAPSTVARAVETGQIPAAVVRKMKIVPPKGSPEAKKAGVPGFVDYKTGKPAWGWRGNADYVYDQSLLGLGGQVAAAIGAGRSPSQEKLQSYGSLAGARFDPLDKDAVKRAGQARLRSEADKLNSRQEILRDVGVTAEHPTREYKVNLKRLGEINKTLYPRAKKPRKTTGLGSGLSGGLSGGGL